MCHVSCIVFGVRNLTREEVKGKRIIEVGSRDVNGSLRPILESWKPMQYVGVDIQRGRGVDRICRAESLVEALGKETFDIVIATELLEHVRDWRKAVSNIKGVCRPNGIILVTTRSYGFPYHEFPVDFWRYQTDDMRRIFGDCKIVALEEDYQAPGVFVKAKKPDAFLEKDLSRLELYSVVSDDRAAGISDAALRKFYEKMLWRRRVESCVLRGSSLAAQLDRYLFKTNTRVAR